MPTEFTQKRRIERVELAGNPLGALGSVTHQMEIQRDACCYGNTHLTLLGCFLWFPSCVDPSITTSSHRCSYFFADFSTCWLSSFWGKDVTMDSDTKAFVKSSTLVNSDWHKTPEGENFFRKFFSSSSTGRKLYGEYWLLMKNLSGFGQGTTTTSFSNASLESMVKENFFPLQTLQPSIIF